MDLKWRGSNKSECKKAPKYRSILSTCTILSAQTGGQPLKGSWDPSSQIEGNHDYNSGNNTSSPPSNNNNKTGVSRTHVTDDGNNLGRHLTSTEKLRFSVRDSASDSGNSVTSYTSLCKPYREDSSSGGFFNGNERRYSL
ncbi:serine/arginine repetitive matrix protein 4-like [Cynoglossus semilaevis]|uniref:serine/arginine repetitive matrix protein 4-like n=1 Tax=Cynoglossus semilaevis TaxID=244447 RepID=UPI000D62D6AD|nr:serine/arginine repetitive matrix protein 4-like [Cynoglossus semilaevis]